MSFKTHLNGTSKFWSNFLQTQKMPLFALKLWRAAHKFRDGILSSAIIWSELERWLCLANSISVFSNFAKLSMETCSNFEVCHYWFAESKRILWGFQADLCRVKLQVPHCLEILWIVLRDLASKLRLELRMLSCLWCLRINISNFQNFGREFLQCY